MAGKNVIDLILNFDIRDYNKDQAKIRTEDKKTRKQVEKPMKQTVNTKGAMTQIVALGGAFIGLHTAMRLVGGAFTTFTEFQSRMANVGSLGVKNVEQLTKSVEYLSLEVPKSLNDLSEALYEVVSAGVDATDQMEFLKTASVASVAGLSSTKEAVDLLTLTIKNYGLEWKDASYISDLAFQAVKDGKTNFGQLSGSLGQVIPLAQTLGVTVKELFGVMSTLTGVTGNTAEVTTQFRSLISSMLKPTTSLKNAYKSLGVESAKQLLQQKGLHGSLMALKEVVGGSDIAFQKLFRRVEAQTFALTLAGVQSDTFIEKLGNMDTALGNSTEAFNKNIDKLEARILLMSNSWDMFTNKIIEFFAPAITTVTDTLSGFFIILQGIGAQMSGNQVEVARLAEQYANLFNLIEKKAPIVNINLAEMTEAQRNYELAVLDGNDALAKSYQIQIEKLKEIEKAKLDLIIFATDEELARRDKVQKFLYSTQQISLDQYVAYLQSRRERMSEFLQNDELAWLKWKNNLSKLQLEAQSEIVALEPREFSLFNPEKIGQDIEIVKGIMTDFETEMQSTTYNNLEMEYQLKRQYAEANLQTALEYYGLESEQYATAKADQLATDGSYARAKESLESAGLQASIGGLASFMYAFKGQNKVLFAIGKRAAQAQALVNTYLGVTAALKYPPPFSAIAAAAQLALGLANVAKIEATAFSGGGLITPQSLIGIGVPSGEDGIIAVQRQEMVMNRPAVDNNYSALEYANKGGKIAPAYAEGGIVGDVPAMDMEGIIEAIENMNINIYSETDAIRYRRETEDEYISNENKRVFG